MAGDDTADRKFEASSAASGSRIVETTIAAVLGEADRTCRPACGRRNLRTKTAAVSGRAGAAIIGRMLRVCVAGLAAAWAGGGEGRGQALNYERPPISYSESVPNERVARLGKELAAGKVRFEYDADFGYLPDLLRALDVPVESQALVFSKTSLQARRISPRTPRALYFNDEIVVGYCVDGDLLEIAAADAALGTLYYTIEQTPGRATVLRQTDRCTLCHAGSQTGGVPGHLVRSAITDAGGMPLLAAGSYRTTHASPFEERWGGWYVTGTHGSMKHRGNFRVAGRKVPAPLDNSAGQNRTELRDFIDVALYPTPHSDVVALMVLEHQTEGHNRLVRANFETRQALVQQADLNRETKQPADHEWDSTRSRIKAVGEDLVQYLLYSGEFPLTAEVEGTSGFRKRFAALGPFDPKGRSLRDFDLVRRMFRHPCSHLVYTEAFRGLPPRMKEYVWGRFDEILSGKDRTKPFDHLSAADRQAIREILAATHPDAPAAWKNAGTEPPRTDRGGE